MSRSVSTVPVATQLPALLMRASMALNRPCGCPLSRFELTSVSVASSEVVMNPATRDSNGPCCSTM